MDGGVFDESCPYATHACSCMLAHPPECFLKGRFKHGSRYPEPRVWPWYVRLWLWWWLLVCGCELLAELLLPC